MAGEIFMRVEEVAQELGVSIPYAYKLIEILFPKRNICCKKTLPICSMISTPPI